MARKSSRIEEMRERNEVSSCMWGLFSILESCQGRLSHKVITNVRPANRQIIDYPRKLLDDPVASFDEECRKIHNRAADVKGIHIERNKCKLDVVKRQKYGKTDVERLNYLLKTHKRRRRSSQDAYQSSSCCANNAARLMAELPSTSAEMSLNRLTLAAILGAVCVQNHHEESKISEYLQRNSYLGQIDQISIQQVQMRAKAFVDQMFIDRKLSLKEGRNSGSKSFSDALDVLNSKRNLFMELLPDPNSMLTRRVKKLNPAQTEKDTIKSLIDANTSECEEGLDETTSAKTGIALSMDEGNTKDDSWPKINYPPSDKIVILKPLHRNAKNVACNCCSSLQFPNKTCRRVSEVKTAYFSFRKIKKKLKHTFGVTKKDTSQLHCSSTPGVGTECICDEENTRKSFSSSTSAEKKKNIKSTRGSDIACADDSSRRKVDYSSARYSNKEEFDVILEAKKHLSTRLSSLNSVEAVTSKNSPRTLERILSSPEHDLWPYSPRRDSLYISGASEMRVSPYNTSPIVVEGGSHARNESRSNTEIDQSKSLPTVDAKASSMIPRTETEADYMKTHGDTKIVQMKRLPPPESRVSGEMLSETISTRTTKPSETTDLIESHKCDDITMDSVDGFPPTPSNSHHLDIAENIKFQEDHQSPVSVLEPFFVEDASSPPTITLQTGQFSARKQLQPRRLDFQDSPFESLPQYQEDDNGNDDEEEEDHLYHYVQSIMEASCLNWDHLSEITTPPEELLLHESLFDEVELPPLDFYYDPKLVFDHINEVLTEIYKHHYCSPPWLSTSSKSKTRPPQPLAELVVDEIFAEAEFFLSATTERRTLDQIVSKDVANCRWWLDVRLDVEHIAIEISEAVMEESLLHTLLEILT